MAKKIWLSLCGGFAVIGLILLLVGAAFGGRPGNFSSQGGRLVYSTWDGKSFDIGAAPYFMHEYTYFSFDGSNGFGYHSGNSTMVTQDWGGARDDTALPGDLYFADIYIAAGYLTVQYGPEPGLEVNGPMPYYMDSTSGGLQLRTEGYGNLTTRNVDGRTHYFYGGEDVTTDFILTLPNSFDSLVIELEAGSASVTGLRLGYLDIETEVGAVTVQDCTVDNGYYTTDVGTFNITGDHNYVTISTSVGAVKYEGHVAESMDISCEVGSVKATIPRPANYGYMVSGELASVKIDGQSLIRWFDGDAMSNTEARPLFIIDCELGAVDISFR